MPRPRTVLAGLDVDLFVALRDPAQPPPEVTAKSGKFIRALRLEENPCTDQHPDEDTSNSLPSLFGDISNDNSDDMQESSDVVVMDTEETVFQQRLRRARRNAGLTQTQVVERAGVLTMRQYSGWERGETKRPHPGSLKAIADVLGVTPLWLEGEGDDGIPARNS